MLTKLIMCVAVYFIKIIQIYNKVESQLVNKVLLNQFIILIIYNLPLAHQ
jgi:hypothetical protein